MNINWIENYASIISQMIKKCMFVDSLNLYTGHSNFVHCWLWTHLWVLLWSTHLPTHHLCECYNTIRDTCMPQTKPCMICNKIWMGMKSQREFNGMQLYLTINLTTPIKLTINITHPQTHNWPLVTFDTALSNQTTMPLNNVLQRSLI